MYSKAMHLFETDFRLYCDINMFFVYIYMYGKYPIIINIISKCKKCECTVCTYKQIKPGIVGWKWSITSPFRMNIA